MAIKFKNKKHEQNYNALLTKMKKADCYHKAVAYLLTLDSDCAEHISDLFNFEKDEMKPMGALYLPWQTGTSVKTTRLMINLWSGLSIDFDKSESVYEETRCYYAVDEIFSSTYARYYFEAIRLRYPEYTAENG